MTTLADLLAQRTALDEQIKAMTVAQRSEAIERVKALMNEYGLSLSDLASASKRGPKGKTKATAKVAAKYRDATGNSWSGRGLQPKWLKAALATGKKLSDFKI